MRNIPHWRPLAVVAAALTLTAAALTGPASAATLVYEAENATLAGGASVATDHAGYVGTGFVGGYTDGAKGAARTSFAVTASGQQTLALRYANGTGSAQTLSLYVNGAKVRQISLAATTDWDTWGTTSTTASLAAGSNTVAYAFDSTDSGNVNLDDLTVTPVPAAPAGQLEAESATLSGGAVVQSDHNGYTGTGFVGGYTDGDKGNAATAFTVSSAAAGATPLTLRYANGTGSPQTLSLYLNGTKVQQISLPATANWDTWATQTVTAALAAGTNTVTVKFDATDSGNVNLDNLVVGTTSTTTPPPTSGGLAVEAETSFYSGGPAVSTSVAGYSGSGHLTGFTATGARVVFTANLPSAGTQTTTLRYSNTSGAARTLSVYANGVKAGQVALPSGAGWQTAGTGVALRAGLNTITYERDAADNGDVAIDRINVAGAQALADRGATLPYTEYEAESGTTNGTVLAADRTYQTVASESSGRRAVQLSATGSYVQIVLTRAANALTVRYSIPDNSAGTGVDASLSLYANGTQIKDLALTSRYSWVYGAYPYTNNPADGSAHRFYDESRTLIGDWPAGTVLKLQKDAGDTAASYTIDLLDAEQVTAGTMPAGFVSAPAPSGGDDTAALTNAISAAKSAGQGLWIPAGTYRISARFNVQGVTIRGAGPWYTILKGTNGKGGFFATGGNVQISDLAISGDSTFRNDSGDDAAFEGNFGTGSQLQNILIFHSKVGLWADNGTDGLYVVGVRIRDTYADGVNLHGNVRNTRVDQSSVRNTGDDALAMFSDGAAVTNSAFTFNTLQLPMLANTAAIYGGAGNKITDNLMYDTVTASAGITVSTRFNPVPLSGTTVVARNTLTRTGGYEPNWGTALGALWIYADTADITTPVQVTDTTINDSTYQGILLSYGRTITGPTFDNVTVATTGTYGIVIDSVSGSATFTNTKVSGTPSGGLNNPGTAFTIIRGPGNSGF